MVYGVATFYNFFTLKPQGAHTCVVCLGTACYVKGAAKILGAIEEFAKIKSGETTADKELSLLTVRCIGACGIAPAVVYDGNVSGRLNAGSIDRKTKRKHLPCSLKNSTPLRKRKKPPQTHLRPLLHVGRMHVFTVG